MKCYALASSCCLVLLVKTAAMAACLQTFVARWLPPRHAHSWHCGDNRQRLISVHIEVTVTRF